MIWLYPLAGAVTSAIATPVVIALLKRWKVVDVASDRSSHKGVAIRGVGLATLMGIVAGLSLAITSVDMANRTVMLLVALGSLMVAMVGAVEDFKGLPIQARAGAHFIFGALFSGAIATVTDAPWWAAVCCTIFFSGYVNAANFMDGINGISGIHGAVAGTFYAVLGILLQLDWLILVGSVTAACFAIFLPWNLLRRGTFLGDSGSYLLGGLIALTATAAWMSGLNPLIALGPTLIYCIDTGLTLVRRIVRRDKWFEPHREHVYQRIVDSGLSHSTGSIIVGLFVILSSLCTFLLLDDSRILHLLSIVSLAGLGAVYLLLPRIVGSARLGRVGFNARKRELGYD